MEILMSVSMLPKAPGAGAAQVTGILSIVFAILCFPAGLVLGIVAIVKHSKARRLAREQPEAYARVPNTGLVTGIIGLVLPFLLLPVLGIVSAIAIPAFLQQRDGARAAVVQANLKAAMEQAERALVEMQARAPGQIASQDAVIRALSAEPAILSLHNPYSSAAPAFQLGSTGPLGTVMVYAEREEASGVTTWSIQFRAQVRKLGQEQTLQGAVITRTEEHIQRHTEDGWQVVQPPADTQPPVETPAPVPAQPPVETPPPPKN
jgi:uncharacterized iron-regulated membrane protein